MKNREVKSKDQPNSRDEGKAGRRLAQALLLLLIIGGFFFCVSDSPGIARYRQLVINELGLGGGTADSEPADAEETEDTGSAPADSSGGIAYIDPKSLPEFAGEHYVTVNNSAPVFPDELFEKAGYTSGGSSGQVSESGTVWTVNKKDIIPYEYYGELDDLGRCSVACGCLGKETMPADNTERGDISGIHPSGWAKAQNWERCHLIAWALSDENANECNLITGTHYLNYDGMRPLEEETEHYIWNTGNHVLYMVRPVFSGDELIARGVQMTAQSVEDGGKGLSFNVYLFNVTPGAEINYMNGVVTTEEQAAQEARAYVINTRSGVFHYPSCDGAKSIYKKNRKDVTATRKELTDQGYIPCGYCEP